MRSPTSALRLLRTPFLPPRLAKETPHTLPAYQRRTFLPGLPTSLLSSSSSNNSSLSSPQTITATRPLPYPPQKLYTLISDIDSYSTFLPYCLESTVLQRDAKTKLPTLAGLRVGWGGVEEMFRSRVRCSVAEGGDVLEDKGDGQGRGGAASREVYIVEADASGAPLFDVLKTRWEISSSGEKGGMGIVRGSNGSSGGKSGPELGVGVGVGGLGSVVSLHIEVAFTSPIYAALSQAVVPKVAGVMVDAFEKRAREMLGGMKEGK